MKLCVVKRQLSDHSRAGGANRFATNGCMIMRRGRGASAPAPGGGKIKVRFGFPVTGNPAPSGRYQLVRDSGFKCASRLYDGAPEGVVQAFAQLHADAVVRGLTQTGQSRQIADQDNVVGGKTVKLELQVGVQ